MHLNASKDVLYKYININANENKEDIERIYKLIDLKLYSNSSSFEIKKIIINSIVAKNIDYFFNKNINMTLKHLENIFNFKINCIYCNWLIDNEGEILAKIFKYLKRFYIDEEVIMPDKLATIHWVY